MVSSKMINTAANLKDYADECMDPGEHNETLYLCLLRGDLYQRNKIHNFITI